MKWRNMRNFEHLPHQKLGAKKLQFSKEGWSLLQIQNNYGKTSTMHLLRSVFTGKKMPKNKIKGYRYRQGRTDWGGDPEAKSEFSVMLSLDDEDFEITTILDWKNMSQVFHTYREGHGKRPGWNPPEYFRALFEGKMDFAELLILDGEKARTLNRSHGENTIGRAIRQVTGLSSICDLIDENGEEGKITELIKDLEKTVGSGGKKTSTLENNLLACIEHREWAEGERDKLGAKLKDLDDEILKIKGDLDDFDEKYKTNDADFNDAVSAKTSAKTALDTEVKNVLKQLFNPGDGLGDSTWEDVKEFYTSQIRGKLPGEATGDWFKEIVEDFEACICGTAWNDKMKKNVLEHSESYVDSRIMPRIKRMQKKVVESSSTTTVGELKAGLDARRRAYMQASKKERELRKDFPEEERTKYRSMSRDLGSKQVKREEIDEHFQMFNSENRDFIYAKDLHRYTSTSNEDHNFITTQPHIFREIMNISEIRKVEQNLRVLKIRTGTSAKKADGALLLKEILEESIARILQEIQKEMEVQMNIFASKMPGVDFAIKISESNLIFINASGDIQEDANESAELGAIYGLVSALNQYADVSLPIVVDTPLAGFGKGMSKSWVDVIGNGFEQGVGLLNSGEKDHLRFWWSQEDLTLYTFLRENEEVRTGKDPDGKDPSGPMYVDSSDENFDLYEVDVGYEKKSAKEEI